MLKINHVGRKHPGREPLEHDCTDDALKLEAFRAMLCEHSLDPMFEAYGDFAGKLEPSVSEACGYGPRPFPELPVYRFSGNFYDYSWAFSIDTDDPALIEALIKELQANKATELYKAAKREHLAAEKERARIAEEDWAHKQRLNAMAGRGRR